MRSQALLCAALLVAGSHANPYNRRSFNSTSRPYPSVVLPSTTSGSSLTSSPSGSTYFTSTTWTSFSSLSTSNTVLSENSTTPLPTSTSLSSSLEPSNSTTIASGNASTTALCTGCILEAYRPSTTWFSKEWSAYWTSVVVTATIITHETTYYTGTPEAIETIVTEYETVNHTSTVIGAMNETVTYSAPLFLVTPIDGVELTMSAGPTYVIYRSIYGGLELAPSTTDVSYSTDALNAPPPVSTCAASIDRLKEFLPTRTEDWSYFIQTVKEAPTAPPDYEPVALPPSLIEFLKEEYDAEAVFSGSDIATCTLRPTWEPVLTTVGPPAYTPPPFESTFLPEYPSLTLGEPPPPEMSQPPPGLTKTTTTYLSTTYESTSSYVTIHGCLRCDTAQPVVPPQVPTQGPDVTDNRVPEPTPKPNDPPVSAPKPDDGPHPNSHAPDVPGIIASIINNQPTPNQQRPGVTIGDSVYTPHPAQPTQPGNNPNQPNPNVVIGSDTLTPGQTTVLGGVTVINPSSGGGSRIIVGGSTVAVQPNPTHVLTVGDTTVTANPQGQFVIGDQTLVPGGSAITVDNTVLSLGPSGTIAVVGGITQTLGYAPFSTPPPVLTAGNQVITASVIGGSTQFVLGDGQTLTQGGAVTYDGTTYSLPADGSSIVVNGVTSTLNSAGLLPVLTLDSQSVTASVQGGTTAFIFGPGTTLTPGGTVVVDGTSFSMPQSGSVIVVDGTTSTFGQGPITPAALTIQGKTYSATVRDGTTEYVVEGTTLRPGDAITISGTTYSLDPKGTALIVNGSKTSTLPKTPASNSATTTGSASKSVSTGSSSSSTTTPRQPGAFIASGIGISSKGGAGVARGFDKSVEGIVIGLAGWLLMLI